MTVITLVDSLPTGAPPQEGAAQPDELPNWVQETAAEAGVANAPVLYV